MYKATTLVTVAGKEIHTVTHYDSKGKITDCWKTGHGKIALTDSMRSQIKKDQAADLLIVRNVPTEKAEKLIATITN